MMTEDTSGQVQAILANIKHAQEQVSNDTTNENINMTLTNSSIAKLQKKNIKQESIRGIPKSGRFWKSQKEKFSTMNKTKGLKQDFEQKTKLRIELKRTKELSKQITKEMKQKEMERKERRRENLKKAEENRQKSEIVQVITNSAKLKRMRKKQLRFIQKRDTNKNVEASK